MTDPCITVVYENEEQLESFVSVMTPYVTKNVLLIYHNALKGPQSATNLLWYIYMSGRDY